MEHNVNDKYERKGHNSKYYKSVSGALYFMNIHNSLVHSEHMCGDVIK